jgi:predicted nucleic acid-binding protein
MTRPTYLVDAAVFAYALGAAHPMKQVCQAVLSAAGAGVIELHASTEMVQELLFHRMRKTDRQTAAHQARDAATVCVLHDFNPPVLYRSIELVAASKTLGGRDAVHAATALQHGLDTILSPDRDFDVVAGLRRVDPADALAGP